jgi:hypothetical protein
MATAKLPYDIFKDTELYEVFYNYFSRISIIGKDDLNKVVTFRVQGEGIPIDDKSIVLELYKFEGVKPFVIGVKIFA